MCDCIPETRLEEQPSGKTTR